VIGRTLNNYRNNAPESGKWITTLRNPATALRRRTPSQTRSARKRDAAVPQGRGRRRKAAAEAPTKYLKGKTWFLKGGKLQWGGEQAERKVTETCRRLYYVQKRLQGNQLDGKQARAMSKDERKSYSDERETHPAAHKLVKASQENEQQQRNSQGLALNKRTSKRGTHRERKSRAKRQRSASQLWRKKARSALDRARPRDAESEKRA